MYIRKSTRSYKGKTYTNYVLVESVYTPQGPRQTTICSLGDLSPRPREEWLKLTRKIEDALTGQGRLIEADDGVKPPISFAACEASVVRMRAALLSAPRPRLRALAGR